MSDPRGNLFNAISIEGGYVRPFDGFIFLCGGLVDATSPSPTSVRDAIFRELAKNRDLEPRVRLAEEYKDWSFDGHYKDLLTFEEHIAQLSAVIVLVLESPGSLAELGLFTALEAFRKKLMVFISNHHYEQTSFIRLGPVKYLEESDNRAACFPWIKLNLGRESLDLERVNELQLELFEAVKERLPLPNTDTLFDKQLWLHRALLVCELLWLMSALTITELVSYLEICGVNLTQSELRQTLFILEKMGLIAIEARSTQRFYVSKIDRSFIKWNYLVDVFDAARFQSEVAKYYENDDKKRFRALQQSRGVRV